MKSGFVSVLRLGVVAAALCVSSYPATPGSFPRFVGTGGRLLTRTAPAALPRRTAPTFDLSSIPVHFEKDLGAARFRTRTASDALLFETGGFRMGFGGSKNGVRFRFTGARSGVEPAGWQATGSYSNYFLGRANPQAPVRRQHFAAVRYQALWPGVDLLFYGQQRALEYDFQVAPHSDPAQIRLKVDGADSVSITDSGELRIRNRYGETKQRTPVLYQVSGQARVPVSGGYRLYGKNSIGFWVGPYDHSLPLVIDPVLEFSSYLGGQGIEVATGLAVDNANNIYITGYTQLDDFAPTGVTVHKFVARSNNTQDAFLVKLNGATKQIVYINYYGGSSLDQPWSVAVDSEGAATIIGFTTSSDLPLANAYLSRASLISSSSSYGFAARFSADGASLAYSTYTAWGAAYGVALNSAGAAWIVGTVPCITDDFPVDPRYHEFVTTPDAEQSVCTPGFNEVDQVSYIVRLSKTGFKEYATFYTPPQVTGSESFLNDAAVDQQDNLYVSGTMLGTRQITRYDVQTGRDFTGTDFDAEITKFDRFGRSIWTRSLGGEADEEGLRIAVDANSNAYVAGYTTSKSFPATAGAFQRTAGSTTRIPNVDHNILGDSQTRPLLDGFVAKYNSQGQVVYATYLGGSGDDFAFGMAVDSSGRAYVTGYTNSQNFPVTPGAFQAAFGGGQADAFVTALAADGSRLDSSTFFGGTGQDEGYQVALDRSGNVYLAGGTQSADLPLTSDALQTLSRSGDAMIAKLNLQPCVATVTAGKILPAAGGAAAMNVNTDTSNCAWDIVNSNPWLTVTPSKGAGPTPVQFTFVQNTASTTRLGVILLNGHRSFVFQDGQTACRFVLFPAELALSSNSERRTIGIQAPDPSCTWNVQSDAPWLKILSPVSGIGTGTITIGTDQNDASSVRTGSLNIGSQKVTVGQSAGQCNITLSSETGAFGPAGGLGTVRLLASSEQCPWQAQSQVTWISVLRGTSGYGTGRVTLGIAPNNTGAARTGNVNIGGQAFGVTQAAVYTTLRDQTLTTGGGGGGQSQAPASAARVGMAAGRSLRRALAAGPATADLGNCGSKKPSAPIQLDSTGRQVQVTINRNTTGCPISVSSLGDAIGQRWMTVSIDNPNVQNPLMNVSASPNTSSDQRKNYIQVVTGDTSQGSWQVEVVQAGVVKAPISVSPRETLPADSGSANVAVSAADGVSPCTWAVVAEQLPGWVRPDSTTGVCGTPLQFSYDANPNASVRLGSIKFNTDDVVQLEQAAAKPTCAFSIADQPFKIAAAGDTVTFNVKTDSGCTWSATTNHDSWIKFPGGGTGTGSGPLAVQVLANDTTSQRTIAVSVDQAVGYILEAAAPSLPPVCGFSLSPNAASFGNAGGKNSFQVQTDAACAWKAAVAAGAGWVNITLGSSATGPGTVSFSVDPNAADAAVRSATISVQGTIFTINEDAGPITPPNCNYTLSPTSGNFTNAAGSGSFQVQTASGCTWQASLPSSDTWVKISSGSSGTGQGTVNFAVDANPQGSAARSSTITVQGKIFRVTQDAGPINPGCSYTLSPSNASFSNTGGDGSFQVQTTSTCAWQAGAPSDTWVKIQNGSGTGSGSVTFTVDANPRGSPARTATISVQGAGFTIRQDAGPGTTSTISASPNPVTTCNAQGLGKTTITWSTDASGNIEVHIGSPTGGLFASGPSGKQETGEWIGASTTFFLTSGATVLAQTTASTNCSGGPPQKPSGTLSASPNPLTVCSPQTTGSVTLSWSTTNITAVEIRQGTLTGTRVASGGASGNATITTSPNTTFLLVDTSGSAPPTSDNVLATLTIGQGTCPTQVGTAPPTTDLAESIRDWGLEFLNNGVNADGGAHDNTDPNSILSGASSMLLQSVTATQIRITRTIPGTGWNLSAINALSYALAIDFPGSDWRPGSPYIRLTSAAGGTLSLAPRSNVAFGADQGWVMLSIPLAGNATWQAVSSGQFDLRNVTQIQISFDSIDTGWDLLVDALFLR